MTAQFIVADVFDGLATLEDGSVDLVVTSPPFLALRSYLPADHPDKGKEIGSEPTPAAFIDSLLAVTAELRRVLAPHGSVCVELGDTYAGSTGGGEEAGNPGRNNGERYAKDGMPSIPARARSDGMATKGAGWPLNKSLSLIPESFRFALAYGINPHTGQESPAGKWRIRNVIRWVRPNPPVGALGDKWRPATSELVIATVSGKRYWDDLATRRPASPNTHARSATPRHDLPSQQRDGNWSTLAQVNSDPGAGAPLLDWWEIPPGGYTGAHYAVFPPELVEPCVKAMCPLRVCQVCGEPSRRIVSDDVSYVYGSGSKAGQAKPAESLTRWEQRDDGANRRNVTGRDNGNMRAVRDTLGWSDCGHDSYRPGVVLDPFVGSGTTILVADAIGYDTIGIDIDGRNRELWEKRRDDRAFTKRRQMELL